MGGHRRDDAGGRHAEPATVERTLDVQPSLTSLTALPTGPATGSRDSASRSPATGSRGPATGSRGPATGSRGPATGSRGPATGSRRAPGNRRHWVPIALAIWIASFLAVPAAVLVHQAVSGDETPVVEAGETHDGTGTGAAPASGTDGSTPVAPGAPGSSAPRPGGGEQDQAGTLAGSDAPVTPAAEVVSGQVVLPGGGVVTVSPAVGQPSAAAVPGTNGTAGSAASASASASSAAAAAASSSAAAAAVSSSPAPAPAPDVQEPPVEAAQPGAAAQEFTTP